MKHQQQHNKNHVQVVWAVVCIFIWFQAALKMSTSTTMLMETTTILNSRFRNPFVRLAHRIPKISQIFRRVHIMLKFNQFPLYTYLSLQCLSVCGERIPKICNFTMTWKIAVNFLFQLYEMFSEQFREPYLNLEILTLKFCYLTKLGKFPEQTIPLHNRSFTRNALSLAMKSRTVSSFSGILLFSII